jgi:hypothetical protein
MKKVFVIAVSVSLLCHAVLFPSIGECSETWQAVSGDFRSAVERANKANEAPAATPSQKEEPAGSADMIEIEYGGKLISVDIAIPL